MASVFPSRGLEATALRSALVTSGVLAIVGLLAGAVRILPLLSDPSLPWSVAQPFARSIVWLALEVACAAGWTLGWGLACARAVDRGEARVYAMLGRSPSAVLKLFAPHAAALALLLACASWLAARDAREPGRVLAAIIESGRVSCTRDVGPHAIPVPFLDAQWLCASAEAPRLFLRPPAPRGATLTAASIRLDPDVRGVELEDVHLAFGAGNVTLREMRVRRLPALVASASLEPFGRALAVSASALAASFGLAWLILQMRIRRRIIAVGLGGLACAAAFGTLRAVDRAGVGQAFLPLVPFAAVTALALGAQALVCLRRKRPTATP